MTDPFIAIICGLKSEAAAVRRAVDDDKIRIGVSGANAARAEATAALHCRAGAKAVISIGVSGGLDPALASGDLLIGKEIIAQDGAVYKADGHLTTLVQAMLPPELVLAGALFGADRIVDSAEEKAALYARHHCLAVDMESHGAAKAAAQSGVPFLAIRAVADPASRALPEAALNAVAPDGSTQVLKTLGAALRDPKQFPALISLGADSAKALKTINSQVGRMIDRVFLEICKS